MDHNDRSQINTPHYYKYSNKNSDFVKVYHFSKDMSADLFSLKGGILVKVHDVTLRISFLHDSSLSTPPHHGAAWEANFRSERPIWGHGEGGRCFANPAMKQGAPGCLGVYKGWTPTQLCGDYFINRCKDPY